MSENTWQLVPVPPPTKAPVQDIAETLDLVDGLEVEKAGAGGWRCDNCSRYQTDPGAWQVWVPDSVMPHDRGDEVTEQCRSMAYNGEFSAWCLPCARKLGRSKRLREMAVGEASARQRTASSSAADTADREFAWVAGAAVAAIVVTIIILFAA